MWIKVAKAFLRVSANAAIAVASPQLAKLKQEVAEDDNKSTGSVNSNSPTGITDGIEAPKPKVLKASDKLITLSQKY